MKHLKNQRGVALILELILVAVVFTAIGAVGYQWYQKNYSKPTANSTTTDSNSNTKTESNSNSANINAGYLVIKEFGIRFKLATGQGSLQYVISNNAQLNRSFADFTTTELLAADVSCTAAKASLGSIGRYKAGDSTMDGKVEDNKNATKIGDYYYLYVKAGGAQCSDNDAASNLQVKQLNILRDTVNAGVEAAK